ncbi:hypothetical protein [Enhygromyxa salina]|uniref:Lipoprotein n=1 Tax=Enhygromyxa salina TaxID=215803 RepID=A0A2S9YMA1_9BACT|nr:hypothetical protein [Enhygromyxa salina]PRQ06224.1 hypothetical protein ENSA7_40720 [Enhygromyxa salina]
MGKRSEQTIARSLTLVASIASVVACAPASTPTSSLTQPTADTGTDPEIRAPVERSPAPAASETSEADSPREPKPLTGPPPGLSVVVDATPVRTEGGYALDLRVVVTVTEGPGFDLAGLPAPNLTGETTDRSGSAGGFADGCYASFDGSTVVRRGESRVFERRHGENVLDVTQPGQTLTLEVGLCRVGLPDGRWEPVPAAEVVLEVSDSSVAQVSVTTLSSSPGSGSDSGAAAN